MGSIRYRQKPLQLIENKRPRYRHFLQLGNGNPLLSASISVAMNTTAFGLIVAIPLLLMHALLQTKTNTIVDSLEMASVKFLNAITERQLKPAGA